MIGMKSLLVAFALFFVVSGDIAKSEGGNSVGAVEDMVKNALDTGNIPNVQGMFGLPDVDQGEEMMKEKCDKNGGNGTFELYMEAKARFEECVSGLVDIKTMQAEINKAKPTGDLDAVFKKYCHKTPIVKNCTMELINGTEKCFSENERSQLTILQNITDSLMNFICFKEGDRIALFIAEGGPECLTSKADAVQMCVNETIKMAQTTVGSSNISTEEIPEFVFDKERCGYFTDVQKCVVQKLEDCKEPTPANIIGSLFDFVRKSTPCTQYYSRSTGSSLTFAFMSILLPFGAILLSRIEFQ